MTRIFPEIPNCAFNKIVKDFAFEHDKPWLTVVQQYSTIQIYIEFATQRN